MPEITLYLYLLSSVCLSTVSGNMSFTPVKGKKFGIGTQSSKLFQLSSTEDVALTLDLTNRFLRNLQIDSELSSTNSRSLIEILNSKFEHVQFHENSRLEERLRIEVFKSVAGIKKCKGGRQRSMYDAKVKKIAILASEIVNVQELKKEQSVSVTAMENEPSNDKENSENFENTGIRIDKSTKENRSKR